MEVKENIIKNPCILVYVFRCAQCVRVFGSAIGLENHRKKAHPMFEEIRSCEFKGSYKTYTNHGKADLCFLNECKECSRKFQSSMALRDHSRSSNPVLFKHGKGTFQTQRAWHSKAVVKIETQEHKKEDEILQEAVISDRD